MRQILIFLALLLPAVARADEAELQAIRRIENDSLKTRGLLGYAWRLLESDRDQANELFREIEALCVQQGDLHNQMYAVSMLSSLDYAAGHYAEARARALKALGYYQSRDFPEQTSGLLMHLGSIYEATGTTDSAIIFYLKAVAIMERQELTAYSSLGRAYTALGSLYADNIRDHRQALHYYQRAEWVERRTADTLGLVTTLSYRSGLHHSRQQYGLSRADASAALLLARQTGNAEHLGIAYQAFARCMLAADKQAEALQAAEQAVHYAGLSDNLSVFLSSSIDLADLQVKQGRARLAVPILLAVLDKSARIGNSIYLTEGSRQLAAAYAALGDYRKAYQLHQRYTSGRDSIAGEKHQRFVRELDTKYQVSKKEQLLARRQLEAARQDLQLQKSRQLVYGITAGLVVSLLVLGLLYANHRHRRSLHKRELEVVRQEKEIQLLQALAQGEEKERSRIAKDLHDGVAGMLAAVKMHLSSATPEYPGLGASEGYRLGMKLLDEASGEVRKTSHNLMPEVLLQHGLDTALRRYCVSISNPRALAVEYDSLGEIGRFADSFELSVYRIVQELLNNVVRHSAASQAIVQLSYRDEVLSITVEDNGVGFDPVWREGHGTGLRGLQARIEAINGRMELDAAPGNGVSAYLEFETAGLQVKQPECV